MADVPSVNPEPKAEVAPEAATEEVWIDPIYEDEPLPDEIGTAEPDDSGDSPATEEQLDDVLAKGKPGAEEAEEAEGADTADDEQEGDEADEPEADEAGQAEGGEPGKDGKPPRRRSKARTDRRATQRELDALKTQNQELNAKLDTLTQIVGGAKKTEPGEEADDQPAAQAGESEEEVGDPPKLEDFDYDMEKFTAANTEWQNKRFDQIANQGKKKAAADQRTEETAAQTKRFNDFKENSAAMMEAHDDFEELVFENKNTPICDAAARIILDSEVGPELAYYLATHEDEARPMLKMTEAVAARAVGRIEARLEAEKAAAAPSAETKTAEEAKAAEEALADEPSPKKRPAVTQAPEPIPDRTSGGAPAVPNAERLDYESYREGRLAGKIR